MPVMPAVPPQVVLEPAEETTPHLPMEDESTRELGSVCAAVGVGG